MAGSARRGRWLIGLGLVLLVAVAGWLGWEAWHWPDVGALVRRNPASTAFIDRYRAEQREAGRPARVAWTWVGYEAIAPTLKHAVLVAEDIRFFSHRGFEPSEWRDAVERAIERQEMPRGASTITQQLAKNLWLTPSRSPVRKAREAILTWQLERRLSKRRILELYLNVVEFGPGIYGAEAASRAYFRKRAADLSADEAAQLAAALPMPSTWHPGVPGRAYRRYVDTIRRRMDKAQSLAKLLE